jgi:hypothetical protein
MALLAELFFPINIDEIVKSHLSDGLEKSFESKACEARGMRRTYGTPQ